MPISLTPITKSTPVTVSLTSKASTVSVSTIQKNLGSQISIGQSIGLLLALTYAEAISTGGLQVTLISKS